MPYNKKELLALPDEEKVALAEELWMSVEKKAMQITEDEVAFAEERLKMHEENPKEGMTLDQLKNKMADKYGF